MQFAVSKVLQESLQLARSENVLEIGEQVHVSEWVDGNKRKVRLGFAEMVQWMGETFAISGQEIDVFCKRNQRLYLDVQYYYVIFVIEILRYIRFSDKSWFSTIVL